MSVSLEREWDFDGGRLPLDFANTVEWHLSNNPTDRLQTYADLVSWSEAAGVIDHDRAHSLYEMAEDNPEGVGPALARAHELRQAIFRVFLTIATEEPVKEDDLATINRVSQDAAGDLLVVPSSEGYAWEWTCGTLDCMLGPIARSAADLLTSDELSRIGVCAEDDRGCGYLFLDTSRNRSRKWCSMEACGNRAKAKRYYRRRLVQTGGETNDL